jgi:hypothetical protein
MLRLIRVIVLSVTAVIGLGATAHATEVGSSRNFGLGFQFGDPTGFTGKAFIGRDNALDFGLAFSGHFWGECRHGNVHYDCDRYGHDWSLHGDFLWQDNLVRSSVKLDWHIGVGARVIFWNTFGNGGYVDLIARMPLGLDLTFNRPSFMEVFFEIAPGLVLTGVWFEVDAALGVRFYF